MPEKFELDVDPRHGGDEVLGEGQGAHRVGAQQGVEDYLLASSLLGVLAQLPTHDRSIVPMDEGHHASVALWLPNLLIGLLSVGLLVRDGWGAPR